MREALYWGAHAWHHSLPERIIRRGWEKAKILPNQVCDIDGDSCTYDPVGDLQEELDKLQGAYDFFHLVLNMTVM